MAVNGDKNTVQANLYFFERRMSTHTWPVLADCQKRLQANIRATRNGIPEPGGWRKAEYIEKNARAICGKTVSAGGMVS